MGCHHCRWTARQANIWTNMYRGQIGDLYQYDIQMDIQTILKAVHHTSLYTLHRICGTNNDENQNVMS